MSKTGPKLVPSAPAEPLEAGEFAGLMLAAGINAGAPLAVAVSGGPDSMALALLAGEWAKKDIHFLTFDHGLRAESAAEARQTGEWLAARGLSHTILDWPDDQPKPSRDVQAAARKARYNALEGWCAARGVEFLLLAHHLEDQAETLLMRLARGSGVDGLSAMSVTAPAVSRAKALKLMRPLLYISKARLVATLEARDQQWIDDPSNRDRSYLRVQARELLAAMPLDGLTPERLAGTARRMARVRAFLDRHTTALLDRAVTLDDAGHARLEVKALLEAGEAGEEIILRVLSRLTASVGGRAYPPRLEGIERLLGQLKAGDFAGATLAGCVFSPIGKKGNALLVAREVGNIQDHLEIAPGETRHWDGRFEITLPKQAKAAGNVAALGEAGWREILLAAPDVKKSLIPHAARLALPVLRAGGEIVSLPHLGYATAGFAGFTARFLPLRPLYPDSRPDREEGGD